jgi:hypothetical protein
LTQAAVKKTKQKGAPSLNQHQKKESSWNRVGEIFGCRPDKPGDCKGILHQTVLQRVKRGELEVVHVTTGRKKGIWIKVITRQSELFDQPS